MLQGVWHFSFTVMDLDRSVDFYTRLLGFELVHVQEQRGDYTSRLVGYPDAHLRIGQLAVPGRAPGYSTHDLELVQYLNPTGTRQDPQICHPGAAHMALTVDDIHALHRTLERSGVRFFSPPNAITSGVNEGGWTCYFEDPDAIVLELVQPPVHRVAQGATAHSSRS
ncbi:VOC family protein [Streptomyces tubercidicus]|uniref:VOC family protein n=1 Tax=Streptomyces tubercidicus TaxID=47759 RepID=UPI002E1385DC|nr:VOC family protein [Streptomyces tubercidicus]